MVCPCCQGDARFVNRRGKSITTLLGLIRLQRPYYHCPCGEGRFPWDERLGLNARGFTPAAQEVVTLAGILVSFAKASADPLRKLSGLRLSESTVQRITEDAGERLRELLEEQVVFGEAVAWDWQRDAQGRTCAYVSLDATGIRQQGPGGAKADGRMAYVAKIYTAAADEEEPSQAAPGPGASDARYLAGFYDLDELGLQLRRQAAQVGWDQAQQQVALSDGGAGLEEFFRKSFPRAVCILDFWHVKEHLVEFSKAWFGANEAQRKAWLDEQCPRLKHQGGPAVLAQLEAMDLRGRSRAAREAHRVIAQYFRNHGHRMDYPQYVRNGWQIGSGHIEAACKSVIAEQLKCSGMRWGEDGANAVSCLRALWLSEPGQWDAFWRDHPN